MTQCILSRNTCLCARRGQEPFVASVHCVRQLAIGPRDPGVFDAALENPRRPQRNLPPLRPVARGELLVGMQRDDRPGAARLEEIYRRAEGEHACAVAFDGLAGPRRRCGASRCRPRSAGRPRPRWRRRTGCRSTSRSRRCCAGAPRAPGPGPRAPGRGAARRSPRTNSGPTPSCTRWHTCGSATWSR